MNLAQTFRRGAQPNPAVALEGRHHPYFDFHAQFVRFPFVLRPIEEKTLRRARPPVNHGSNSEAVLRAVEGSSVPLSSAEVCHRVKLSRETVRTALNELVHRQALERTNDAPPFLYRIPIKSK